MVIAHAVKGLDFFLNMAGHTSMELLMDGGIWPLMGSEPTSISRFVELVDASANAVGAVLALLLTGKLDLVNPFASVTMADDSQQMAIRAIATGAALKYNTTILLKRSLPGNLSRVSKIFVSYIVSMLVDMETTNTEKTQSLMNLVFMVTGMVLFREGHMNDKSYAVAQKARLVAVLVANVRSRILLTKQIESSSMNKSQALFLSSLVGIVSSAIWSYFTGDLRRAQNFLTNDTNKNSLLVVLLGLVGLRVLSVVFAALIRNDPEKSGMPVWMRGYSDLIFIVASIIGVVPASQKDFPLTVDNLFGMFLCARGLLLEATKAEDAPKLKFL